MQPINNYWSQHPMGNGSIRRARRQLAVSSETRPLDISLYPRQNKSEKGKQIAPNPYVFPISIFLDNDILDAKRDTQRLHPLQKHRHQLIRQSLPHHMLQYFTLLIISTSIYSLYSNSIVHSTSSLACTEIIHNPRYDTRRDLTRRKSLEESGIEV